MFDAPVVSAAGIAGGVTGPGSLEATPDGLRIVASWVPLSVVRAMAVLGGVLWICVGGVPLALYMLSLGPQKLFIVAGLVVGPGMFAAVGIALLAKALFRPTPFDAVVPWPETSDASQLYTSMSFRTKRRGWVFVTFAQGDEDLAAALSERINSASKLRPASR